MQVIHRIVSFTLFLIFKKLLAYYYIEIAYYKETAKTGINELLCSGHLHNHHSGQEKEFCQQHRTLTPTPRVPCWAGSLLSPHFSDSAPQFYL